ncbi:hypothetical protein [Celerinatantimonas sp. MCCC 1A17872]|uniref:hypothetical protein n=1 Tax=Celerinatantimonas sp. MCCC 1A17872 TaxID=3177514 RepID=UPI0038C32881
MLSLALSQALKSQTPHVEKLIKKEPMLQHWLDEAQRAYCSAPMQYQNRLGRVIGFLTAQQQQLPKMQAHIVHFETAQLRTILSEVSAQSRALGAEHG